MSHSKSVSINIPENSTSHRSMSHHSPSHHSISMSNQEDPELGQDGLPTRASNDKKTIVGLYDDFCEKFPNWDLYMIFELFVFMMSFFFLVGESKDSDVRGPDSSYLYQINSILIIDFLFRLLSINIDSIKRKYWNHVLHCILPLIMWLLAAFYKFDNVFGSDPIKVLNAMLFTMLNLVVFVVVVMKFLTLKQIKGLFKKDVVENNEDEIV